MAISIIDNQAIGFNIDEACKCGGGYCQPIQTDDKTMLQGFVTAATGNNLLLEGDFSGSTNWTLGAGWSISGSKLHATNISGTTATSIAALGLTAGKLYLIQTYVDVTSVGSAGTNQGFILKVNGQSLALPSSATAYHADLTATWLFKAGTITTDVVEFSTNESTIDFDINYFRIYELSEVGLATYNGDTLDTLTTSFTGNNSLKYYFNGNLMTTGSIIYEGEYSATTDELVMFELLIDTWSTITSYTGCMTIRIYDTLLFTNRVRNGAFATDLSYWTVGNYWAFSSNRACYTNAGASPGTLSQRIYLIGGTTYTFQFTLSGMSLTSTMQVQYDGDWLDETITYTGNSISPRTHTFDLSNETGVHYVDVYFFEGGSNPELTFCIDDISCVADYADTNTVSNCINLQTTHDCTLLFTATNYDNAFGFDYVTGSLRHYLRVLAKLDISGYPEEKEEYLFSDNSRKLLMARSETQYEINVTDAPDYVHSCLRMLRLNDAFTIDAVSYIADSGYDLRKRKSSKLKQSQFTVKEVAGISTNYSCS